MTEKAPDNKAREIIIDDPLAREKTRLLLVNSYEAALELLEYHLCEVFKTLETQADIVGHNRVMHDIQIIVGNGMKDLVEKMAREIVNVGKAEIVKEKQ